MNIIKITRQAWK